MCNLVVLRFSCIHIVFSTGDKGKIEIRCQFSHELQPYWFSLYLACLCTTVYLPCAGLSTSNIILQYEYFLCRLKSWTWYFKLINFSFMPLYYLSWKHYILKFLSCPIAVSEFLLIETAARAEFGYWIKDTESTK